MPSDGGCTGGPTSHLLTSLKLFRDILRFYQERVLGKTRDKIILNILNHQVSEMNYVECFKLRGYMHTFIMFLQCALWNKEWKENAIDKVILSHKAMLELLKPEESTKMLAAELLTDKLELKANLVCYGFSSIFFPLHSSFI